MVSISKIGKTTIHPKNFHPISILQSVILDHHTPTATNQTSLIHPNLACEEHIQHSATHQLLRITNHVQLNCNRRNSTGLVFLNLEIVFDKVWHVNLLAKLLRLNFPYPLILLIKSYLSNRSFRVKVNYR